jgi:hypothetical protein
MVPQTQVAQSETPRPAANDFQRITDMVLLSAREGKDKLCAVRMRKTHALNAAKHALEK